MSIVAGIDHAFGFPAAYLDRHGITTWTAFLDDFCEHWPTHQGRRYVEEFRGDNQRTGGVEEFRLTEKWTSSAKSVFLFDVQGSVAKSTHAGIPWLRYIRQQAGDKLHFWPFDGWNVPAGKSVVAEVYPSIRSAVAVKSLLPRKHLLLARDPWGAIALPLQAPFYVREADLPALALSATMPSATSWGWTLGTGTESNPGW